MELRIFNRDLEPLGIVDEAISTIWQPSYWDKGDYGDVKILLSPVLFQPLVFLHSEVAVA